MISNFFNFYWVFKKIFNKHDYNFDDVDKNGYSRSFENKIFWNKKIKIKKFYHLTQVIL